MEYMSLSRADLQAALEAVKSRLDTTNAPAAVEHLAKLYSEILSVIVQRDAMAAAARHRALRTMYRRNAGIVDPVRMKPSQAARVERFGSRLRNITSKAKTSKNRRSPRKTRKNN
jgi:hypothetical protein